MLALSRSVGYGVLALSCVTRAGGRRVLTKEIGACTDIPLAYLSKVLSALVRAGLLDAKRGKNGGFRLVRPATEISVSDVADAIEGPEWSQTCLLGIDGCWREEVCPTHAFWPDELKRIRNELDGLSLRKVADYVHRGGVACACDPAPRRL